MLLREVNEGAVFAFRRHRHDILNELQLIRAYLQMGQIERGLGALDRTASWLQSLTKWNANLDVVAEPLLWVAATCPSIQLAAALEYAGEPMPETIRSMNEWLIQADEALSQSGIRISITVLMNEEQTFIKVLDHQAELQDYVSDWQKTYPRLSFQVGQVD